MDKAKASKVRILIVEDNSGDVELLRLALNQAKVDCELTVLEDGGAALAYIRQHGAKGDGSAPELAILDLNLPKNDGLELLEEMRSHPGFAHIPVLVLSSSSLPRERAKMSSLQIERYIMKPSDLDEFLQIGDVVRDLLSESEAARQA